jgi:hypothetical protein
LARATPPGWYPEHGTRRYRWWDGIQWAFYAPDEQAAPAPATVGPTPTNPYAGVVYPTTYRRPTNSMATASLVLGIVGMVTCTLVVPSLLAVVFGIVGLRRANRPGGVGSGKAVWGVVLGGFMLAIVIIIGVGSALQ